LESAFEEIGEGKQNGKEEEAKSWRQNHDLQAEWREGANDGQKQLTAKEQHGTRDNPAKSPGTARGGGPWLAVNK